MNISVVGLGKLGLCSATVFASKGHHVIGVDNNVSLLSKLNKKECPIVETGLKELLDSVWKDLIIVDDISIAVSETDITLIIVPTPSEKDGSFSNSLVLSVLKEVGLALQAKGRFHIVAVVSTVMPGSSEEIFKPLLEELSGKVCGRDFGLVYNPEFIALGEVIKGFLSPDMVLVGSSDNRSSGIMGRLYSSVCENVPNYVFTSLLNAEIIKLALNCCVTTKISFANELSAVCERVPGANIDEVTQALGFDTRVGRKYLKSGLGFGGPCFPRDNRAFIAFSNVYGYNPKISRATIEVNKEVVPRLIKKISELFPQHSTISLFGLSYKSNTKITEESQALEISKELLKMGYKIRIYDSSSTDLFFSTPEMCVESSDGIIILVDCPEFSNLNWLEIDKKMKKGSVLLDCWNRISGYKQFENIQRVRFGNG